MNENRKRNKFVNFRMSQKEYEAFLNNVRAAGISKQSYLSKAVNGITIQSAEEIDALKELSKIFADQERQLRGIATNINQIAHRANGMGLIPTEEALSQISSQIKDYRRENEQLWRSIRWLINLQKVTEPSEMSLNISFESKKSEKDTSS